MVALVVLLVLLIVAVVFAVTFIVMFIVAAVRFHRGEITPRDLQSATDSHKKVKEDRKQGRTVGFYSTNTMLGFK